jgi:glyoxylase-like metal-dependent hydrolase (beta-lactamase superfamily II)
VSGLPPEVRVLLAPNPGPMTLTGTNTYLIGDPAAPVVVVDPGPLEKAHLAAIVSASPSGASEIVLTHWHHDHSDAAPALASRLGCPVRAANQDVDVGGSGLDDRAVISVPGGELMVIATPGHTADSVCLLLRTAGGNWLLTGDTVLGSGTSVIMHPDGHLGSYLASLDRLSALVTEEKILGLLPGHGPVVEDPAGWLGFYRRHRAERLSQVRAALAAGDRTAAEVVARVYADVDRSVWAAAERSVAAQLEYLASDSG